MYLNESPLATSTCGGVDSYLGNYGDGASLQGLGDNCGTVCHTLQSLEKSAERLCSLVGPSAPRCINARQMVMRVRAGAIAGGCNCQATSPSVQSPRRPFADRGFGGLGQLTVPPRQRPTLTTGGPQLQMPPHETITGFPQDVTSLNAAQIALVNRTAEFIVRSWSGTTPITSVRVTGYINTNEWQSGLGERRATAVRDALVSAINRLRPGLVTRLRWKTEDRGLSSFAKVDVFLWAGPTPPPVPPLLRLPSPAEAARTLVQPGQETPEQRIQRILRELPPAPAQRRSFSQMFWQRVDQQLNSTMSRLNVPTSLRGHLRAGVHAAINRGSEALLNEIVGATRLPGETQEAIRSTTRALLAVPIR
jgi:hypothetical protein